MLNVYSITPLLQVYIKLMELKMMQLNKYNFKPLHHIQQILKKLHLEESSRIIYWTIQLLITILFNTIGSFKYF